MECDDEYWENADSALAFKQPRGKPSQVSYFINMIKINLIHSHALRTIVSPSQLVRDATGAHKRSLIVFCQQTWGSSS
jgi:hypothetical protein